MTPVQIPSEAALTRGPMSTVLSELGEEGDRKQQLLGLLLSDPNVANQAAVTISDTALRLLPVGTLPALVKGVYGRFKMAPEISLCEHVCDALSLVQPLGIQVGPDPQRLAPLPRRWRIYSSYRLFGVQLTNLGMDRRAVLAPMQSTLIEQAVSHVQARFKDPALTPLQRAKLLDDFGPALVELERVLTAPAARKEEIQEGKKTLAQQLAEAKADAEYAETQLKLRQKLLVPREELLAAARRHLELKKKEKAKENESEREGTQPLEAPGARRLI